MDITLEDIETYLSEVKETIRNGKYKIAQNTQRKANIDLF